MSIVNHGDTLTCAIEDARWLRKGQAYTVSAVDEYGGAEPQVQLVGVVHTQSGEAPWFPISRFLLPDRRR